MIGLPVSPELPECLFKKPWQVSKALPAHSVAVLLPLCCFSPSHILRNDGGMQPLQIVWQPRNHSSHYYCKLAIVP